MRVIGALLLALVAVALCAGCTTTQQTQTMGVLKALATVPMAPGVDTATAEQVNAWRTWGLSIVEAYDTANSTATATTPSAAAQ